jgi:isopentenyl diphosphate isomerase/L-lactate dehydrogenase-like FMN-dependent dehydrogenase
MNIDRKFPTVASMEAAARRRVPRFAFEYLIGGIGAERGLTRNRQTLDAVTLRPRYLTPCVPDLTCSLMGRRYDLPLGISPMGLSGLIWPRSAEFLAATAKRHKIPFVLSTFATTRLEEVIQIAPEHAWFQLSLPNDQAIAVELIARVKRSGYETLVLTIDVPTATRRERDIRNGLSVPPRFTARTALQILQRPQWAVEMLQSGIPEFENLKPFLPPKQDLAGLGNFISRIMEGRVSPEGLKRIRDQWAGKLVVKGVLHPTDAETCRQIGTDAIIVSNHGGRQLDAAPAPIEVLPEVRRAIGTRMPVLVDGGIRSGLDIARAIACGADFVFLARAFMFGVAAIGRQGGDHVVSLLGEELRSTLAQLGCRSPAELPGFVWPADFRGEARATHEPGDD